MQNHPSNMELEQENYILYYQCSKYSYTVRFQQQVPIQKYLIR